MTRFIDVVHCQDRGHAWFAVADADFRAVAAASAVLYRDDLYDLIGSCPFGADGEEPSRMNHDTVYLEKDTAWPLFAGRAMDCGYQVREAKTIADEHFRILEMTAGDTISVVRFALPYDAEVFRDGFIDRPVTVMDHHSQPVSGVIKAVSSFRSEEGVTPVFVVMLDEHKVAVPTNLAGFNMSLRQDKSLTAEYNRYCPTP